MMNSVEQAVPLIGGGMLLALIFKSIMHLLSGWKTLADVERDSATAARADADQARLDAIEARTAAAMATERISDLLDVIETLKSEVADWKIRYSKLEQRLVELERKQAN